MDTAAAVASFAAGAVGLAGLPLVTDGELRRLYGEEVIAAVARLELLEREQGICSRCGGQCCADIGCELYSPHWSSCPIHQWRPIACRLHFCHRFRGEAQSLALELRDVFLGSLSAAESRGDGVSRVLDCPPLGAALPRFTAMATEWVRRLRLGHLSPDLARALVSEEAWKHRAGFTTPLPGDFSPG